MISRFGCGIQKNSNKLMNSFILRRIHAHALAAIHYLCTSQPVLSLECSEPSIFRRHASTKNWGSTKSRFNRLFTVLTENFSVLSRRNSSCSTLPFMAIRQLNTYQSKCQANFNLAASLQIAHSWLLLETVGRTSTYGNSRHCRWLEKYLRRRLSGWSNSVQMEIYGQHLKMLESEGTISTIWRSRQKDRHCIAVLSQTSILTWRLICCFLSVKTVCWRSGTIHSKENRTKFTLDMSVQLEECLWNMAEYGQLGQKASSNGIWKKAQSTIHHSSGQEQQIL